MSGLTGTGALLRLAARRDRVRLPVWLAAVGGLVALSGSAVGRVYPDQEAVDGYAALVASSPVTVAFAGPPVGLHTQAGVVVYEVWSTAILGVGLMAVTLASRHSRAEEEAGRTELVRAAVVGRHAPGAAAALWTTLACALLGAVVAAVLVPTALAASEAVLLGAGTALLGAVGTASTLCLAQLFVHARTVTAGGLALVAAAYVLRAAGDVRDDGLVWLSPAGWVQATHVPAQDRWWPLALPLVATLALLAVARLLADHRDLGGGLVPSRPGPAEAATSLTGTVGLGWRLQRTAVAGWSVALALFGAVAGALGTSVQDMADSNPTLADYLELTAGASVVDQYLATMVAFLALMTAGYAVWAAGRLPADERSGQLELVLAGPLARTRVALGHLLVVLVGTTVVLAVAAASLGLTHASATGSAGAGWAAARAQVTYLPAVLVLVGVVVLFRGWLPRWGGAGWVLLAFAVVIAWLGGLLDPPDWLADLSPFSHVPRVPVEPAADPALAGLLVVAALLVAAGVAGFRRRDVGVG